MITFFIRLILVDKPMCIRQCSVLSLFFDQELQQVLRGHKAFSFGVLPIDHVYLFTMGQQVVEMLNLLPSQEARFRLVTFL